MLGRVPSMQRPATVATLQGDPIYAALTEFRPVMPYCCSNGKGREPDAANPANMPAMPNLHGYLIIDASSGTVLPASACYLVADDAMPDDAWHAMADDAWSDDDAINAARRYGRKLSDVVTTSPKLPGEA